jgi:hypothetical protein
MQSPEDPSPNTEPLINRSFRSLPRAICVGSCALQGRPGSPGSDGASPYRASTRCRLLRAGLERRSMLRAILLVVVLVLVLDLLWGQPQRAGDARRPVRTEPLPTIRVRFIPLNQSVIFVTSVQPIRTINGVTLLCGDLILRHQSISGTRNSLDIPT